MKNRRWVAIAAGVVLAIGIAIAVVVFKDWNGGSGGKQKPSGAVSGEEELSSYEEDIRFLTETVPTLFFFYGDQVVLRDEFEWGVYPETLMINYKRIDMLSEEELVPDDRAEQYALVVNDYTQKAELTENDILLIAKLIKSGRYTFIYIGKRYASEFVGLGVWDPYMGAISGNGFSVGYYERVLTYTPDIVGEEYFTMDGLRQYPIKIGEEVVSEVASLIRTCR